MNDRSSSDRVLGTDAARAVGRFNPDGPTGYRAATMPGAPVRATRGEAEADEATWLNWQAHWRATDTAQAAEPLNTSGTANP